MCEYLKRIWKEMKIWSKKTEKKRYVLKGKLKKGKNISEKESGWDENMVEKN